MRDRIPEIIRGAGRTCETETLGPAAYRQALLDKLVEEAEEARGAPAELLATELADLLEVLDTTIAAFDLDREAVLSLQRRRRSERGGFSGRLQLRWTGA